MSSRPARRKSRNNQICPWTFLSRTKNQRSNHFPMFFVAGFLFVIITAAMHCFSVVEACRRLHARRLRARRAGWSLWGSAGGGRRSAGRCAPGTPWRPQHGCRSSRPIGPCTPRTADFKVAAGSSQERLVRTMCNSRISDSGLTDLGKCANFICTCCH